MDGCYHLNSDCLGLLANRDEFVLTPLAVLRSAPTVRNMKTTVIRSLALTLAVSIISFPTSAFAALTAPTNVSAIAKANSAVVSFKPINSTAGTVVYNVACVSNRPNDTISATTLTSPITLTGLTADVAYQCSVSAQVGTSSSAWVTAPLITPTSGTAVPAAPGSVYVQPQAQALSVTFASVAGATSYEAACSAAGESPILRTGTSSPINFPGLKVDTKYTCSVRAANSSGTSSWTGSPAIAPLANTLASPSSVSAVPGSGSITLSFGLVAGATTYNTECSSPNGVLVRVTTTGSPITLSGLTNGSLYTCTVAALSATGASSATKATPVTPAVQIAGPPGVPTFASLTPEVDTTKNTAFLKVTMNYPPTAGTPNSYNITCMPVGVNNGNGIASGPSPVMVPVTAGASYACQASAVNGYGTSAISGLSAVVAVPTTTTTSNPVAGAAPSVAVVQLPAGAKLGLATGTVTGASGYRFTCKSRKDTVVVNSKTPSAISTVPAGSFDCSVATVIGTNVSAPSPSTSIRVAPMAPAVKVKAKTLTIARPAGWAKSWMIACTTPGHTLARTGTTSSIVLTARVKGKYGCHVYLNSTRSPDTVVQVK